jgi:cell division protein FtsL
MTPTALTTAGRGIRPKQRPATVKRSAAPARAAGAAQGARTATQGARTAVQGARTAAEGARTAVKGARTAAQGTRTMAQGTRTMAQGARTAAQRARTAAEGARTVTRSARAPMVSGPAGGRGTRHRAPVRRPSAPRNPRRISGPARPTRRRPTDQPVVRAPLAARSAAFIRGLPDHALLDRIIRGRYWIPLLGVLLVGIVAMQVEVLKLNAGIGRALEQTTSLQNRNEQLQAAVARGADDQRIESMAAHMGMVMPQPAAIRFLQRHPVADVEKAISNIHVPSATGFEAALTAAGSPAMADSAATTAASAATGGAPTPTPTPTPTSTSSTSPGA